MLAVFNDLRIDVPMFTMNSVKPCAFSKQKIGPTLGQLDYEGGRHS